jgi:uncharacterized protein YggE
MRFFYLCFFLLFCVQALTANDDRSHTKVDDHVHNKLKVNGSAVLHKPADKVALKIGVVSNDKNVQQALSANNEKMQKVLAAIKKTGLSEKEFQTGNFTVEPQYSRPPKEPLPNWHAEIVGYEVRHTLSIHTTKLELVGPVIDAATKEGTNLIEDILFTLQDSQLAESEAIANAVQQAHVYAEAAAKEAGIRLGDILELTVNPSSITPRFLKAERFAAIPQANSTPISPGDVEVNASVSIAYEIIP